MRRKNGRSPGSFQKPRSFEDQGALDRNVLSLNVFCNGQSLSVPVSDPNFPCGDQGKASPIAVHAGRKRRLK